MPERQNDHPPALASAASIGREPFQSLPEAELLRPAGGGLTGLYAAEQLLIHGPNTLAQRCSADAWLLLLRQFSSPIVVILIVGRPCPLVWGIWCCWRPARASRRIAACGANKTSFRGKTALTGESFPVDTSPGLVVADALLAGRSNVLALGSQVVSGSGQALVEKHRSLHRIQPHLAAAAAARWGHP